MKRMEFSPGPIGTLLSGSGAWRVRLTFSAIECRSHDHDARFPFGEVAQIRCSPGWVWATLEISSGPRTVELRGMGNRRARRLAELLRKRVVGDALAVLKPHRAQLEGLWQSYTDFLEAPRYLARPDLEEWAKANRNRYGTVARIIDDLLRRPVLAGHLASGGLLERSCILLAGLDGDTEHLADRNEDFVRKDMDRHQAFFDAVESTPLTPEQRRASVVMEDRNLLVASAGSGKTSTVVGKVGYALLRELVAPDEILIVAFNAHAAAELEERVHERLGQWLPVPVSIKAKTFHAFGLEVIAEVEGARPSVAGGGDADGVIDGMIEDLLETDSAFARAWMEFHALYPEEALDPATFGSSEAWDAYVKRTGEYAKGRYGYLTLNDELAGFQGERAIANWLCINGLDYQYGPPGKRRQASPHHYLPSIETRIVHLPFDPEGYAPSAFEKEHKTYRTWRRSGSPRETEDVIET
ncbi:MAG: UvrD-helicase domain-containing protein, partial [Candidatus Latescibacteria bacterium]|nr:UvrD-helicase domain-containing protein [Candidatus Latescibacterota bacterium]